VTALPVIIEAIVGALPVIITSVVGGVLGAIPMLIGAGIELFIALIGALPQIISTIVQALPQIIGGIVNGLVGAIPQLVMAGVQLLVAIVSNMPRIVGTIVGAIPQIIGGIVGALGAGIGQVISVGGNLVRGIWDGISGAAGWLFRKISGFASDVVGKVAGFFGIKSPSTRMRDEVGQHLPSGIGEGVEKNEAKAIDPIIDLNKKMIKAASDIPPLGFSQEVSQSITGNFDTPSMMPMTATATPNYGRASQAVTISGPLVSVASMSVRNDRDIRTLSTQLKTDMTRELRAQGVLA